MAILSFWTILSLQVPKLKSVMPEQPWDVVLEASNWAWCLIYAIGMGKHSYKIIFWKKLHFGTPLPRYNSMPGVARYFLGWGMQSTEGSKGNVLTEKTRFFSPTILEHQVLQLKFHEPDRIRSIFCGMKQRS